MNELAVRTSRDNLRRAMELRSLSSFELSEKIGRNRTYIDDFIKGRKNSIAMSAISRLAAILNVKEQYVTGEEELPEKIEFKDTHEYWEKFSEYLTKKFIEMDAVADPQIEAMFREFTKNVPNIETAVQILMDEKRKDSPPKIYLKLPYQSEAHLINIIEDNWSFPKSFVERDLHSTIEDVLIMPISDMSMAKSVSSGYAKGDYVIIDKSKNDVRSGGIFGVFVAGHVLIRRVELVDQKNSNRLSCRALNPEYASFEIDLSDDVHVVGTVVAHIRRV